MINFRNFIILWISQSRKLPLEYEIKVEWLISKGKYENEQNCEQNFLESNFNISNWKKISKLFNFPIWTIPKTSNLENSKNFQFGNFRKFAIWQVQKNLNLENSKNFQFAKFEKSLTRRIPKVHYLKNQKNFQCGRFQKFPKYSNFEKHRVS